MWPNTLEDRLVEWHALRVRAIQQPLQECLTSVNDWWMRAPIINHYLHWDDHRDWPNPWDLLAEDRWCDLAKALGIMYTLMALDRSDIHEIAIIQTADDNLVQVNGGKYILNWAFGELLNNQSAELKIKKQLDSTSFKHNLR